MNPLMRLAWQLDSNSRTGLSAVLGIGLFVLLNRWVTWTLAFLISWNISAFIYLLMIALVAFSADADDTRQRIGGKRRPLRMLTWVIITTMLSNLCIGIFMGSHSLHHRHEVLLSALAILQAWLIMHAAFGRYYGEVYYSIEADTADLHRGLRFQGTENPNQLDFDYLAFMIALSYSSGDVDITRHAMRKVVMAHALISFLFYSTVVTAVLSATALGN